MKKLAQIILAILFLASFLNMAKVIGQSSWPDFNVYYYSAESLFYQNNPYALKGAFLGGYLYPPISLLLFYPLIVFPMIIAGEIWEFISIVSLLFAIWFVLKFYKEKNLIVIEIIGILVFNFFPVKFTLGMGQINNVVLLCIAAALYVFNKNKKNLSGFLLGISLLLKYFIILIFPYFLIKQNYRLFISILTTVVVISILSFLFIKTEIIFYFFEKTLVGVGTSAEGYYYNQALSGFLIRDFGFLTDSEQTLIRLIISVIMIFISFFFFYLSKLHIKKTFNLEVSIIIALSLIVNTSSLQHHFVLMLIPLLITYFILKEHKTNYYYYIILMVCYILAAINIKNPTSYPALIQSHVFYGILILWIFDLYLLRKYYR